MRSRNAPPHRLVTLSSRLWEGALRDGTHWMKNGRCNEKNHLIENMWKENNTSEIVISLYYYACTVLSNAKKCHNHDMRRSVGEGTFLRFP